MPTEFEKMRHSQIWGLLNEYADIRDHLEDIFNTLHLLQQSLQQELEDLSLDFDDLQMQLDSCSRSLFRFKSPEPPVCGELPSFDTGPDMAPGNGYRFPSASVPGPKAR